MATATLGIRPPPQPSSTLRSRAPVPRPPWPSPPLVSGGSLSRRRRLPLRLLAARPRCQGGGEELHGGRTEEDEMEYERLEDVVVRTLLIDNYDSYTYNIYQELSVVNGVPPVVVYNDEWTWESICHCLYEERAFDNIVISPGPGTPTCPRDVGICLEVLRHCKDIPILGVCLGHQALGYVHGAQIVRAPEPIHGRLSGIEHSGCHLFSKIPSGINFKVMRYHSLVIDADSLPKELIPTAWVTSMHTLPFLRTQKSEMIPGAFLDQSDQLQVNSGYNEFLKREELSGVSNVDDLRRIKVLMGVMHSSRPHYGVQFHPESVATNFGRQIFENFKKMTIDYGLRKASRRKVSHACKSVEELSWSKLSQEKAAIKQSGVNSDIVHTVRGIDVKCLRLQWRKLDSLLSQVGGSENIFCELFGDYKADDTFWLDSSSVDQSRARFSFMGGRGGSLWKQITFRLSDQGPEHATSQIGHGKSKQFAGVGGYLTINDAHGALITVFVKDGFLDFLNKELQSFHYDKRDYEGLPFDFHGGFVGYLGYNLKVECGASFNSHISKTPDACFFFADNLVVIDHLIGDVYILSLDYDHNSQKVGEYGSLNESSWLVETEKRLLRLKDPLTRKLNMQRSCDSQSFSNQGTFRADKSRKNYIMDVQKCLQLIRDGESYELCLTTQMTKIVNNMNNLKLYLTLRNQNPAPYAAWLHFAEDELCICCSSPERFLQLDGNDVLEAKPIKGTIARGRTPEEDEHLRLQLQYSEKDQAENLMIVDLLRNDLGRVCEPGSVHVPRLMEVESYATVHTMVSTIQGKRRSNVTAVDCVRAAFPGGSMTGAPKLRSMELLDSIESCSRGIYSGSIGFFSYNQAFDLNIVIRTVIIHKGEASVGAGGAIVALSNPEDEYAEMLLKAKAPMRVVEECSEDLNLCGNAVDMMT